MIILGFICVTFLVMHIFFSFRDVKFSNEINQKLAEMRERGDKMIKLINVVKKFGKIEAVKGINLEVEKGSLFAFLGENGAGKSTTLSMICTESEPTSGEIFIDDEKLTFKTVNYLDKN